MDRRSFLRGLGCTAAALPVANAGGMRAWAHTLAASPFRRLRSAREERVLVVIRFFGGNDGLNTLVPYTDDRYYHARGRSTAYDLSVHEDVVVRLDGSATLGFHPSFAPIAELYNEGKVVAVQNVGYPEQNLSHFRSADIWFSGSDADRFETTGWYARYLEERYPAYPGVLPAAPFAVELNTALGITLVGRRAEMGITLDDLSYIPDRSEQSVAPWTRAGDEQRYILETERQSNRFMHAIADAEAAVPRNRVSYPGTGQLPTALARVARLIAADLPTQMYMITVDGFDTHDGHMPRHAWLLKYCADAVAAFQRDVEAFGVDGRVCVMTTSEFGRRVAPSGSGTDHGAAAPMFLIGRGVQGGIIGTDPNVEDLDDGGNLKMEHDFRQVYASVLGQWFGASDREIYEAALPRIFKQLPIFRSEQIVAPDAAPDTALRAEARLEQTVPNPFTVSTDVRFFVPSRVPVMIGVYDIGGHEVARILEDVVEAGTHRAGWSPAPDVPAGTYLVWLQAGGHAVERRIILLR